MNKVKRAFFLWRIHLFSPYSVRRRFWHTLNGYVISPKLYVHPGKVVKTDNTTQIWTTEGHVRPNGDKVYYLLHEWEKIND